MVSGVPMLSSAAQQGGTGALKPAEIQAAAGTAAAAQPTITPSTDGPGRPADASPAPIIVRQVQGNVGYRPTADAPQKKLAVNDVIAEGGVISTSANGMVQIQVGIGQIFTIDKLSKVKVSEAIATQGKEKTTVNMEYGRVRFDVTSTAIANDVQIAAPDSTLAVKGTTGGMEHRPGFPTFAFGGEMNTGRFTVKFPQNITATIVGSENCDANNPDPAQKAALDRFVDIGDGFSREGDEFGFVFDFSTVYQRVFGDEDAQGVGVAPPLQGTFLFDDATGNIILYDPFSDDPKTPPLIAGTPTNFNLKATFVGAALRGRQFLRLESDGSSSSRILAFDLGFGSRPAAILATFPAVLNGLATLGSKIYSAQYVVGGGTPQGTPVFEPDRLVELRPSGSQIINTMQFGAHLEGGMGSFAQRGSLLVAGRLPDNTGMGNGNTGFFGSNAMILEVDPRINYLSRALSDVTGDFDVVDFDTVIDDSLNPLFGVSVSGQEFTGLSRSTANFGGGVGIITTNLVIQVNLRANVDGTIRDIAAIVNGDSARVPGDVPLRLVGPSPQRVGDTAGESATPAGSVLLGPAPANIDSTINQIFAQMAYSDLALASGVVERLARNAILTTARDAQGCLNSGDLGGLFTHLQENVARRSGIGGSIFDFRNDLSTNHPCLAPGQLPGGLLGETYFAYDFVRQSVIERDLTNREAVRFSGVSAPSTLIDTTIAINPGNGHRMLLGSVFETITDSGGMPIRVVTRIVGYDLVTGGTSFSTLTTYDNFDFGTTVALLGLGSLGSQVYATGSDTFDQGNGNIISSAGIYALDVFSSEPGFTLVMDPGIELEPALGGARSRGTVFALGGSFENSSTSFSNAILMEVDPRTNYVANVFSAADGDFAVQTGTQNPDSVDPATLVNVVGMTYIGSTLVINATNANGDLVTVQYSPSATNSPADPRLRQLDRLPQGNVFFGVAGNSTGNVPASITLANPTGAVELAGDGLSQQFIDMAYSAQAAQTQGFRSIIRDGIVGSSADPAGCRASGELNGPILNSSVTNHSGQRSGVGQAIRQFRDTIPVNHPCRRQGI